ncbi:MAG: hypothetical protein ACTHQM_24480, partial [Thermoanaerobaculia bacterium]
AKILLRSMASDLKFDGSYRLNLYKYDRFKPPGAVESREIFTRVARHSKHATYDTEGRTVYPFDQGVLRKAWDDGYYHDEIPHKSGTKKYFTHQVKNHGMPLATLHKLRMLPRGIAAIRIDSPMGTPVGLVCFECIEPKRLDDATIKQWTSEYEPLLLAAAEHHVALSIPAEVGL